MGLESRSPNILDVLIPFLFEMELKPTVPMFKVVGDCTHLEPGPSGHCNCLCRLIIKCHLHLKANVHNLAPLLSTNSKVYGYYCIITLRERD
jgi:hypothetical protein